MILKHCSTDKKQHWKPIGKQKVFPDNMISAKFNSAEDPARFQESKVPRSSNPNNIIPRKWGILRKNNQKNTGYYKEGGTQQNIGLK